MSEGLNSDPNGDVGGGRRPAQTRFLAMAEHLRPFLDRALGAWPEDVTLLATRAGTRRRATRAPGRAFHLARVGRFSPLTAREVLLCDLGVGHGARLRHAGLLSTGTLTDVP